MDRRYFRYSPIEVNGKEIRVFEFDVNDLGPQIPGTNMYLNPYTSIREVFDAAGYKTFDTALPQPWVDEWNRKNREKNPNADYIVPRGVWWYDDGSIWGEFVSLETAMKKLGEQINEREKNAETV